MDESEKLKLRKLVEQLEAIRGRHTQLVTVYIPAGANVINTAKQIEEEKSTAKNIKSTNTRKAVLDSLERISRHLKLFKVTPKNGLAIFCGNVSPIEGQEQIEVWSLEPPQPLKVKLYRCDQTFVLDPLKEMLEIQELYGLIAIERDHTTIGILEGKNINVLRKLTSGIPGKTEKGGQCLSKDTLIMTEGGDILPIEMVHNPLEIISANLNNFSIQKSEVLDKWENKKETLKIITKNPRTEIKSSQDHLFYVRSEGKICGKAASELKKGDFLLMPEKIGIEGEKQILEVEPLRYVVSEKGKEFLKKERIKRGISQKELAEKIGLSQTIISKFGLGERNLEKENIRKTCNLLEVDYKEFLTEYAEPSKKIPQVLDSRLAMFIGYFLGDGSMEKNRITLFEQRKDVAGRYKGLVDEIFNTESRIRFRERKNYWQVRVYGIEIVELIKKNFPELRYATNSLIPSKILKSDEKILASFFRGLFDAEGYVSGRIGLGINNKILSKQIQLALLRLGIISSLWEYDNRRNIYSKKPRFTISIDDKESLRIFARQIGFTSDEKMEKLKKIINCRSDTNFTRQIVIDGRKIRETIENYGMRKKDFKKVSNFFFGKREMSKGIFKTSILAFIKDENLKKELSKILDYKFIPVRIKEIVKEKEDELVDISVRKENFIANCLVVHNSAARYSRIREGMAKEYYRRVAEAAKEIFFNMTKLKGILVGGPGPTKEDFLKEGELVTALKEKVLAVKDIGYTDEFGLKLLVEASQDELAKQEILIEKNLIKRFFTTLATKPSHAAYGLSEVKRALEMGAAEDVFISTSLHQDIIDEITEKAKSISAQVYLISTETEEGVQFKNLGGVGAILRYQI
ncbi:helix-turn-helix domain-containing protein [Candidatus Pacearchaeota archaeon]|nr:helix-turn-helix domain-containing protein [Candidatus Pacearchaeota archaeon]